MRLDLELARAAIDTTIAALRRVEESCSSADARAEITRARLRLVSASRGLDRVSEGWTGRD